MAFATGAPRRRSLSRVVLLGCTALSTLAAPDLAAAQTGTQTDAATDATIATANEDAEVVVTGKRPIAESEAAALRVQRESPALVSVVSADSAGRLPDQNVAQAISRLPGVAVQRDQGQARYVNLRGAPINWTTLSIDGINVISPEGRDARFDSIPSAIASQIIVRKAVTPDMPGETIAGNIDVITRTAFDYSGFKLTGKKGVGHVELGDRTEYEAALVLSDRIETDIGQFGVVASGSFYHRGLVTDNFETDFESVDQDRRPGFADRIWARETENKIYRASRENYSLSTRLDWRTNGGARLFAEAIYSVFADDELRNNYIFDLDDQQSRTPTGTAACAVNPTPVATTTGYADICTGNTPLFGTVYGIDLNSNFRIVKYRQSVFTNTIGLDHSFGGWNVKLRGNYTKSVDNRSQPGQLNYDSPGFGTNGANAANRLTVQYDLRDPQLAKVELYRTIRNPDGSFARGARVAAIGDFPTSLTRVRSLRAYDTTKAYTGKLDVNRKLDLGGRDLILAGGLRYDQRTKTAREFGVDSASTALFAAAGVPTAYSAIAIPGAYQGKLPIGYTFNYFGRDQALSIVDAVAARTGYAFVPANFYKVREQVYSGYAMATGKFDWGNIIGGARVEHIRNRGEAFAINAATAAITPVTTKNDLTLIYPSLHVNYDLNDTLKARLSFSTGAARADYDQLRPNLTFSDANLTVSGGNPDARPEKARGVDLYFEYYGQQGGFLSAGVFYKDVRSVLFDNQRTFNSDVLNFNGVDRSQYAYSTITNGGDGYIYGLEGAIQQQLEPYLEQLGLPGWMGGFGVQLNATLNKSRSETPDGRRIRLPGTSDAVYNLSVYYEKYGLSARLSYQNRSPWVDAIGAFATINGVFRGVDGGDFYWAQDDELDASIRYAINRNVELYADFANLLDGPGRRYVRDGRFSIERETFGARYTGGVRVNF